jgi:hypothetical protein
MGMIIIMGMDIGMGTVTGIRMRRRILGALF